MNMLSIKTAYTLFTKLVTKENTPDDTIPVKFKVLFYYKDILF